MRSTDHERDHSLPVRSARRARAGRRSRAAVVQHQRYLFRFGVRQAFAADEKVYRPFPPSPEAIDRMLETMRWVQWLEVEQRHLVWMRAKRYGWRDITIRFACDRSTAWRRWQRALEIVAAQLNSDGVRLSSKNVGNLG
ncbi:DUF6362 family protein [Ralstonia mannitolilytica]|uniref:DUF6362 family protein n=1 Tax=Ralstonia mannitolilytica TaxID=105219 RepID=UPI0037492938